jgi:hypothetical protein
MQAIEHIAKTSSNQQSPQNAENDHPPQRQDQLSNFGAEIQAQ